MAFKMKPGSPMERNFPSAFPKNSSKLGNIIKETAKTVFVPGYGAKKVFEAIKNKFGGSNKKTYSATTGELKTTELQEMKKGEYIPQSRR